MGKWALGSPGFSAAPNDIAWDAFGKDTVLGQFRRNLLILKDKCRQAGRPATVYCPIPDFPFTVQKDMRAFVKDQRKQLANALNNELSATS